MLSQLRCRGSGTPTLVRSFSSMEYSNQSRGGLPRFFSEQLPPYKGNVVRVQGDEFFHITRVLRLTTNDRVELFDGKGSLVKGSIQSFDRSGIDIVAMENRKSIPHRGPKLHVIAAFGTLKGGRADWLIEKCTELGAFSVTPLLTDRADSISENRFDRLARVILAATKQSQRLHEMLLNPPLNVEDILPLVSESELPLLASAEAPPLANVIPSSMGSSALIIVGPEGDFTEKEVKMMTQAGAKQVGLGPLRLRVETASIALLSALMLASNAQPQIGAV